jgi:hypothetical protein
MTAVVCWCRDCRACDPECPDPACQESLDEQRNPGGPIRPLGQLPSLANLAEQARR